MSNAGMAPVDIEDAERLPNLSCTTVASFASSQAQCARFLALTYHEQLKAEQDRRAKQRAEAEQDRKAKQQDKARHDKEQGKSEEHGVAEQPNDVRHNSQHRTPGPINSCSLAGGKALEDFWGRELSRNAQPLKSRNGQQLPRNALGRCQWADFCNALQLGVRAFAAEVELQGQPSLSDSKVPGICLSGGADFIEVQWDKQNNPTYNVYECKATSQIQASHLLQVVLYYMLIKKRLLPQGKKNVAKTSPPSIQCHLIRGNIRGFRVVGCEHRQLPQDEVNYLQGSLSSLLERGGSSLDRISHLHQHFLRRTQELPEARHVLRDPLVPPLSFCAGAHCSTCSMQDKCVAYLEQDGGELQLSGCTAEQADKLRVYQDKTYENGITSLCALASTPLESLRLALGLEHGSPVPEVLQARARVRRTRTEQGRVQASSGEVELQASYGEVELRPRAGPSTLPKQGRLIQVFLSVIVDSTFEKEGSVAGLAAYVVGGRQESGCPNPFSELITDEHGMATNQHGRTTDQHGEPTEVIHAESGRGPAKHSSVPAAANIFKPAGQSTVSAAANFSKPTGRSAVFAAANESKSGQSTVSAMTEGSTSAGRSSAPAAANKSKPAKHRSVFAAANGSKPAGQSSVPAAAPSASTATEAPAVPSTQPPEPAAAAAPEAPAQALPPSSSSAAAAAAAAEAAHYEHRELGLLLSFLSRLHTTLEKTGREFFLHFYVHSNRQLHVLLMRCMRFACKHASSCPSIARQLMWLPELLGQRAGIPGEQQMHSVLEVEMCRFVTKWEGKDLATATQQQWPDKGCFSWDGFPLSSDPPGYAQSRKLCDGLPPTLLWLAFHRSRKQKASTGTSNQGNTSTGGSSNASTSTGNAGSTSTGNHGSISNVGSRNGFAGSTSAHADSRSSSIPDPHDVPSEFHEACRSSIPDLDDVPLGLRKAATPDKLRALLEQNVKAMDWLSDSMVRLGTQHAEPQMPVNKSRISLPLIEGAAVGPAAAAAPAPAPAAATAATDERVAFCSAARDAALLCRATEIHDFMVDRIFSRTPLQQALEDRDTSLIVWEQKQEGKAADVLPSGLTSGCLRKLTYSKDKDKVKYRLESLWDLNKGDSFWLSGCSMDLKSQELKDVLNNGLPLSVPLYFKKQQQQKQQPDLEVSNLPESSIYSVKEQPYFLIGSSTPGFENGAQAAILERTGINIAGYTLQNVCKRLGNGEDRYKVLSAAELLMLPPETDLPTPNKDCASESPHFLEKQKTMQELLPMANIMKKDQRKALNKDNRKTLKEGQRKGMDKDERKALNEHQKKALAWVLAPETRLQLLQGPPGTGKTETMATAILLAAAAALRQLGEQEEKEGGEEQKQLKGQLILVSANTRGAVKELKQRITRLRDQLCGQEQQNAVFVEYITKDAEERLEEKGKKRQCQAQTGKKQPCSNGAKLCSRYCGIKKHRESDEAPTVYILCGTPKYLLDLFEEEDSNVLKWLDIGASWLFIDEGSQMPLPTLLALASMLQPNVGQLFVGGDHRQLPCIQTYDSSSDLRPSFLRYLPFSSAYGYLLEIQNRTPASDSPRVAVSRLKFSHRLPPILRHLISPIYELDEISLDGHGAAAAAAPGSSSASTAAAAAAAAGSFAAAPAAAGGSGASTSGIPDPLRAAFRAIRHASEGLFLVMHNSTQDGKRNPLELHIIERMLAEWHGVADGSDAGMGAGAPDGGGANGHLPAGAGKKAVGIISPHKLQCADWQALVTSVNKNAAPHMAGVEAKTVDGYQGQEAASIIFSSTVSNLATMSSNEEFYSSAHRVTVAFSRAMKRLVVVCSERLLDFLPARTEAYDSMLLWRRLRAMCKDKGLQLGRGEVEGMDVSVFQGEGRLVV